MLERESILPGLREHETVAADAHKRTGELTGVTSRAKDVVQTYGSRAADAIRFVVKIEKQGKEANEKRQRDLDAARRELAELCDLCARIRQRLGLSAEDE